MADGSTRRDDRTRLVLLDGIGVRVGDAAMLTDITLEVRPGRPTALIGPNGSGKSTLLRVMMELAPPSAGRLWIAPSARRAIVLQKPVMLRRSVADNVAFALTAASRSPDADTIEALLEQVGLTDMGDRPARMLSGGEHQRLAIARALARAPALLLLDEATASLDPAQTKIVEDLIRDIAASGVKIVFATHDLGQARRLAGDVVFLARGRIAERAAADTFFVNPTGEAARRFLAGDLVL